MKQITAFLIAMSVWYGIFSFVAGSLNPMEWGTFTRMLAVIVTLMVVTKTSEFE